MLENLIEKAGGSSKGKCVRRKEQRAEDNTCLQETRRDLEKSVKTDLQKQNQQHHKNQRECFQRQG
jgi:hypothetical protein